MNKPIVIFGAGGHAKVIIDIVEKLGEYEIVAVVNRTKDAESFLDYPIITDNELLKANAKAGIIAVGDNWVRSRICSNILERCPSFEFITAIHPSVQVGKNTSVGPGTVITAGAIVNPNSQIGSHCIVNTKASVDHDGVIGDYTSLAPGVTLGGNATIGEFTALSLGASVIEKVSVGNHTVIGAGSLVLRDVPDNVLGYGNPFRVVRKRTPGDKYLR